MRVRLLDNGRVLEGTAFEIVDEMREGQFGGDDLTVAQYVDQVCARVKKWHGVDLRIDGETGEEKAEKLVDALIEAGLAEHDDAA